LPLRGIRSRAGRALVRSGFPRRDISQEDSAMAAKKQTVEIIALACSECKRRNYTTTKNRKTQQEKLELMKYCKWDRKHTLHKETKVK
jgi:large subunit ribosomal protein L33